MCVWPIGAPPSPFLPSPRHPTSAPAFRSHTGPTHSRSSVALRRCISLFLSKDQAVITSRAYVVQVRRLYLRVAQWMASALSPWCRHLRARRVPVQCCGYCGSSPRFTRYTKSAHPRTRMHFHSRPGIRQAHGVHAPAAGTRIFLAALPQFGGRRWLPILNNTTALHSLTPDRAWARAQRTAAGTTPAAHDRGRRDNLQERAMVGFECPWALMSAGLDRRFRGGTNTLSLKKLWPAYACELRYSSRQSAFSWTTSRRCACANEHSSRSGGTSAARFASSSTNLFQSTPS